MTNKKSIIAALGAAAVGAAAPAMLLLGAGAAQAATDLNTTSDVAGVTVEIKSTGSEGLCFYSAEPWFGWQTVKPLPVYKVPFYLQKDQSHKLWFPGIQTGTVWKAKVECPVGGVDYFNPTY
ncbi:hypothetical protein [Mycobacterium hubeiense]|uniref:hypothetical protein n=1 Tax=Mycobacterium hubeiense TaxID=1867256 RepID=UPI000C7F2895|nr:hypothetical protein [Mycobacterium sp. QGD 101]